MHTPPPPLTELLFSTWQQLSGVLSGNSLLRASIFWCNNFTSLCCWIIVLPRGSMVRQAVNGLYWLLGIQKKNGCCEREEGCEEESRTLSSLLVWIIQRWLCYTSQCSSAVNITANWPQDQAVLRVMILPCFAATVPWAPYSPWIGQTCTEAPYVTANTCLKLGHATWISSSSVSPKRWTPADGWRLYQQPAWFVTFSLYLPLLSIKSSRTLM